MNTPEHDLDLPTISGDGPGKPTTRLPTIAAGITIVTACLVAWMAFGGTDSPDVASDADPRLATAATDSSSTPSSITSPTTADPSAPPTTFPLPLNGKSIPPVVAGITNGRCPSMAAGTWTGEWKSERAPEAYGNLSVDIDTDLAGTDEIGFIGDLSLDATSGDEVLTISSGQFDGSAQCGWVTFTRGSEFVRLALGEADGRGLSGVYAVDFNGVLDHGVLMLTQM